MSQKNSKKNISDDAARARKILAKNEPNKVSGLSARATTLADGAGQIGPHFVVQIVHPGGVEQYTVHHPIGVTDLDDEKDWVVTPTAQVPATLKRKEDPSQGELNQARAKFRTDLAVKAGLLVEKIEPSGSRVYFYPMDVNNTRNHHLQVANDALKAARKAKQDLLAKTEKKSEAGILKQELSRLDDPLPFMEEGLALAERALRNFWRDPALVQQVEQSVPQLYRTLTGAFGDQPQVPIAGGYGLSMQAMVDAFSRGILEMDVSESPSVYQPVGNRDAPPQPTVTQLPGTGGGSVKSQASAASGKSSGRESTSKTISERLKEKVMPGGGKGKTGTTPEGKGDGNPEA